MSIGASMGMLAPSSDSSLTVSANGKQTKLTKEETAFIEQAVVGGMLISKD